MVTTSDDKTARIWDINGKQLAQLQHQDEVTSASFSPDGKLIVTTSDDKTARIWDINGKQISQLQHRDKVKSASFSPDGKVIVTGSAYNINNNNTALIWDVNGKLLTHLQDKSAYTGYADNVSFSSDGKIIFTTSWNITNVWDINGKLLTQIPGKLSQSYLDSELILTVSNKAVQLWFLSKNTKPNLPDNRYVDAKESPINLKEDTGISDAHFSPDGKLIATASYDKTARVWDVNGKQLALLQHPSDVSSVSFSPNGKLIITVTARNSEGAARVWDFNGQLLTRLDEYGIESASFSPDSKLIVTVSDDNTAQIWDINGKLLTKLQHQKSVKSASFSPNGKLIVTASDDNTAQIWDINGKLLTKLQHQKSVKSASFSPNGNLIVTVSDDNTAQIWDINGKLLTKLQHQKSVESASFSPNGKLIVTASDDNTAQIWDINGKLLTKLQHQDILSSSISSVHFSPNAKLIVTTSVFGKTANLWDINGKLLAQLHHQSVYVESQGFSPDGNFILTKSGDVAKLWDINGKLLAQLRHESGFNKASFSSNGKLILTISDDKIARVWDINGKQITLIQLQDGIDNVSFSPDGNLILSTTFLDNTARVWDVNGKLVTQLQHEHFVHSASFSPDSKLIVTTVCTPKCKDHIAKVWDISGKQIIQFQHQGGFGDANFSTDGKLIITSPFNSDTVNVWDINGKQLVQLQHLSEARLSPNNKFIITAGNQPLVVKLWNINGKQLAQFQYHRIFKTATFSPDSKLIITESANTGNLQIWDTNGEQISLLQQEGIISDASFSPDSKLILTASHDSIARVWDISGRLITKIKGHQGSLNSAVFSLDGKSILTASKDGTARIWDLSGKQLAILSLAPPSSSPKVEAGRLRDLQFYAPNCAQAFDPWQKALKLYQEISDTENQAVILEQLGNAYYCLSDYTKAIKSYNDALEIAKKSNYLQRQVKNLANLGNVYNSLADNEIAIKYYNDALKIIEQNQDAQLKTDVLQNRGNIYISQGKYNEAIQDLSQALAIDKNASSVAKTKVNLANIYYSLGDYNKAIQYYKEAAEFIPGEALGGLGNVYLALGDTIKAMELHSSSLAKAQQNEDKEAEGNALNNLANALRQAGKLPEAEKYLRDAIAIWENLRVTLDDANKISIFEKQTRTYRLLQEVLIAQNKINEALEISERGRARAFIDLLNKRLSPNQTEQSKVSAVNIEQIKQIAKNENATLVQYSIITDEFKVDGKPQTQDSELYIWVIKPTGEVSFNRSDLKTLWQKENTTLKQLVDKTRLSIGVIDIKSRNPRGVIVSAAEGANRPKRLQRLHDFLIKPIADILPSNPNDRVIFIPQGELFLVPFPALQYDQDKYLIEKHTILTAPSIQVLDFTSKQKRSVETLNTKYLIVGNPTMPKVVLEPEKPPEQLISLPWAEKEAKDIASILKTKALIGKEASKTAILQKMPEAGIIHFATHGLLDDNRGLGSAIALAPSSKDNGLLTAEEILNLKLNADLVVLSACDTGRGRITGDGVIGLSRSLISAGVPSVIVSLWAVDDNSTSFLMTEFYQNLQQKLDKATALRKAMLTTMQKYPEPLNWAAFTLIGESEGS
ncbi:MAG: CHAT domain-containing protein [Nostoc sp.]|uniref:CHAT domain-containing protein n=1 Tax=Nostoc sp. TaxID=1180 RepID=UPI002FF651EE